MNQDRAKKIIEEVRVGYDSIATEFSRTRAKMWPEVTALAMAIPDGSKLLDVGCGNGRLYQEFRERAIDYHGIDISERLISEARRLHPDIKDKLQIASALKIPYENDAFDAAFSIAVWHHLPSVETRAGALKEVSRVVKKHGAFVITVWNLWQKQFWKYHIKPDGLKFGDMMIPWEGGDKFMRYCHAFTRRELVGLLNKNGFSVIDSYYSDGKNKVRWWQGRNIVIIAECKK